MIFKRFNIRFFGLENKITTMQQNKANDNFKKEIQAMISKPTYTLKDYKQKIYDGLYQTQKGIISKFMSENQKNEAQMIEQRKILDCFKEDELLNQVFISGDIKKEIAEVSQTSVQDINMLIRNYRIFKDLHRWLRKKQESGNKIPDNQEDMYEKFKLERPLSYETKRDMKTPKYNKNIRNKFAQWGMKGCQNPDFSRSSKWKRNKLHRKFAQTKIK